MPLFLTFHNFLFVCFKEQNLHFAPFCLSRLVANSLLLTPQNTLFAPKTPLFNGQFALSGHEFHGSERLCLYNCSVIFMLNGLHLAANRTAFSSILPCIQQQNALHLAAKRSAFSTKTHYVQRHIALNLATNSPKTGANGGFFK